MKESNNLKNVKIRFNIAKEIQKEEKVLMLSNQEWKNFQEIINTPQKPTDELKKLMGLEGFN